MDERLQSRVGPQRSVPVEKVRNVPLLSIEMSGGLPTFAAFPSKQYHVSRS
ncbi:hypothetical protein Z949_1904 [Sulfitobacter guttiformis KCTC 32187]|nr:hypothetical protein Z949_1904 [Sulfitobacter guttiformis KCTC 32187]